MKKTCLQYGVKRILAFLFLMLFPPLQGNLIMFYTHIKSELSKHNKHFRKANNFNTILYASFLRIISSSTTYRNFKEAPGE